MREKVLSFHLAANSAANYLVNGLLADGLLADDLLVNDLLVNGLLADGLLADGLLADGGFWGRHDTVSVDVVPFELFDLIERITR